MCQTVVAVSPTLLTVTFEAIDETLKKTTLSRYTVGQKVNVERSVKMGDEIGGHLVAGHIYGTVRIAHKHVEANNVRLDIACPKDWLLYILPKGFIALDGVSLTVGEVRLEGSEGFSVHLIPETLKRTTLGYKNEGDALNIEFDSVTQAAVETILRLKALNRI